MEFAKDEYEQGRPLVDAALAGARLRLRPILMTSLAFVSGIRLAEAQKQEMLLIYQQTIINAFQQVSDSLTAYQKGREFREQQELLAAAAEDADRLSKILYRHGGTSYLQVLASENNEFSAELNLAQAQLNERLALIQLYNALGGGWQ